MGIESHFEHIGPRVSFGEVAITNQQAETFRQTALQGTRIKKLYIGDNVTEVMTTSYATGVLTDAAADYDVYESSFYAKSLLMDTPEFWRSAITFARFNLRNRETKIYNHYEVEAVNGHVESAVRRVRVIRNLSRIAFDEDGEPIEDVYSRQRKMFEQPLQPEDIEKVAEMVDRTIRRQAAITRR